ncbi:helix-turn-helix transcriptional regulator [Rhodovulum sulfidophilum]|nr:helix-turn-helix transcriptional regulator [Rhodovulum sulfidophilum]
MRIAEIRRSQGLSQADLAELAGVEQPTISRIERGNDAVTLRVLRQVAMALGVSLSDLFSDDRTAAEVALLEAFRSLPKERQQGWLDLAQTLLASQVPSDQ